MSIYEVHLGSWRRKDGNRYLTYDELADQLVPYATDMGFTHLELLPVSEYPFDGSWGYQPIGLFAPTSRFGPPEAFARFVDRCHAAGLGVIIDWVPAHFPTDAHGLVRFDGTALYEHEDPRLGFHRDWNTLIYNFGRNEVRNFLVANALFWLDRFHIDALRVDAVASMLYLDYSREAGEWIPNVHGGRENLEAIAFLRELNTRHLRRASRHHDHRRGIDRLAAGLAAGRRRRPRLRLQVEHGLDARHARIHAARAGPPQIPPPPDDLRHPLCLQRELRPAAQPRRGGPRQGLAARQDARRPLAEVRQPARLFRLHVDPSRQEAAVHGRRVRARSASGTTTSSLDWHLLDEPPHRRMQRPGPRPQPALPRTAGPSRQGQRCRPASSGSTATDAANSVYAFLRYGDDGDAPVLVVCNFTPVVREGYRIGVPREGRWVERLNTDAGVYGGSNVGNGGGVVAEPTPWHGRPASLSLTLPPLATVVFEHAG